MTEREWFPFKPIEVRELDYLTELCGGRPMMPTDIGELLFQTADPMFQSSRLNILLPVVAIGCAETLPDIDVKDGARAFMAGVKMYAAALANLSPLTAIPYDDQVMQRILNSDDYSMTHKAHDEILEEAGSFVGWLNEASDALEINDPVRYELAVVGGGVLHVLTTRSLLGMRDADVPAASLLEEIHPELANIPNLEEEFRKLD